MEAWCRVLFSAENPQIFGGKEGLRSVVRRRACPGGKHSVVNPDVER